MAGTLADERRAPFSHQVRSIAIREERPGPCGDTASEPSAPGDRPMAPSGSSPEVTTGPGLSRAEAPEPLRAVHTGGLPELLRALGVSLLVTTYQAGKLVIVREQGGRMNTHFRS